MFSVYKTLLFLVVFLGVFFAFRLALYLAYYDYFSSLDLWDVLVAFVHGMRFDLSISLTVIALPLLLLNVPHKVFLSKAFNIFVVIFLTLVLFGFSCLMLSDTIYFAFTNRHLANEILTIEGDISIFFPMLKQYIVQVLAMLVGFALVEWIFFRIAFIKSLKNPRPFWILFSLPFIFFVLIRASFADKPITVANAFLDANNKKASLTLNGVFASYHYAISTKNVSYHYYDLNTSLKNLHLQPKPFAFEKKSLARKKPYKNVVVLLMESWSPAYIGFFGSKYGITPNLDEIAKKSVVFTNFFASGQRSSDGITASLTGIDPIKGLPSLGFGLELSAITRLGYILDTLGFDTSMLQTSKRGSYYMDLTAQRLGFEHYFGMQDMRPLLDYPDPKASTFGWDYEGYMKLFNTLQSTKKPFFAYFFTGSTHSKYAPLQPQFTKFPHDGEENSFKNLVFYSDWAIGEFMKKARKTSWFKDTVFIFLADHTLGHYTPSKAQIMQRYRIPLIIYAQGLSPKIYPNVASQAQIMPTILDLLGTKSSYYSLHKSVFDTPEPAALSFGGNLAHAFSDDAFISFNYEKIIETNASKTRAKELQTYLQSVIQSTTTLIKNNKLAR